MEDQEFDEISRILAASGSRRSATGALAGLLGLGLFGGQEAEGKDKHKKRRRQQRRRTRDSRRDAKSFMRGIKLFVGNSTTGGQEISVEFGFQTDETQTGACCQGQAAETVKPRDFVDFQTEESTAYLWVDNRYFIDLRNPLVFPVNLSWASDGSTSQWSPLCCKPRGHEYGHESFIGVDETKVLDFNGRKVSVKRLKDSGRFKVFVVEVL